MSAVWERNKGMDLLRVEKVSKDRILDQVSFSLEEGGMMAIMGPSGAGKSTLLYHVAGMADPSGGKIWLKNTEITGLSEDEKAFLRLHRMGFVFQQMNMISNLTILDNILLPAIQANKGKHGKTKAELTAKARSLMEKLSLSGLEERKITQVSGGQLQRACICRSIMNDPKILFADEPTGALNRGAAREVMAELARLNHEGMTILMVTHDEKVASSCERVLYLVDGRIRGELMMGKMRPGTEKQRLEKLDKWIDRTDGHYSTTGISICTI